MTKENILPIENKKPFETVQEVKNEVPSFEEFMKTYEADENLNYDDLSYSDISDKGKGYGPCSWDNKDCPHYLDFQEGYISLYLSCPAEKCGGDGNQYHWKHAQPCGGRMYISTDANIRCMSCGERGHWREWLFRCWKHKGDKEEWRRADWGEFSGALGIVSNLWIGANPVTKAMIDKIAAKVMKDKY